MSVTLSICIPTYNRAAFLGEALDSVISQATDDVEIVVSDNASTDNTEALVRDYQSRFPRILYQKNPENLGADRNFLKVMELASGEYCWLLGSDDALAEGAIAAVMPLLGDADLYLADITVMSFTMDRPFRPHYRLLSSAPGSIYDCTDTAQLLAYFKDAVGLAGLFGYISSLVIRRRLWVRQPVIEVLVGSVWIHVSQILQMMRAGARIRYVGLPLVLNRSGNDSFLAEVGYTRRRLLDLDYSRVVRAVFADQPAIIMAAGQVLARYSFSLRAILADKQAAIESDGPQVAQELVAAYRREFQELPWFRLKLAVWKLSPVIVLNGLRRAYNSGRSVYRSLAHFARTLSYGAHK